MPGDSLDQVLRLVAEGRLTPAEAAPILAALDDRDRHDGPSSGGAPRSGTTAAAGSSGPSRKPDASTLRIEVRDGTHSVLNLRLPVAAGRFALDRVPGISGDQVDRVREALRSGQHGVVLETGDRGGGGVRIVLE